MVSIMDKESSNNTCDIHFCDTMEIGRVYLKEILVIDDEDYISEILKLFFSELRFSVITVSDGIKGLELIKSHNFWAVLCDLKMPGIDGIEVYHEILKIKPLLSRRFVLLTGTVFDRKTKEIIKAKGIKTLLKPFKFEDINRLLEELKEIEVNS